MRIRTALSLILLSVLTAINPIPSAGQSGTSSALTGSINDATGAVVPNATVKPTEESTGAERTARSNAEGRFLFAQVNPGTYRISVAAEGFGPAQSQPSTVAVGQTIALNFTLKPAATSQTVEVTAQTGLLSLENPNTSTTLEAKAIERLPNPGQDLTYVAQFAQGALMNTAGSSNDAKIWQCGVQRTACYLEWLHPRWLRYERSMAGAEHRPFHESRHRSRCSAGSDCQYQLLLRRSGNLRLDFVGTRGLHEPFEVQLNGYQTVCDGCFAPFPYQKPLDQRFGNVNEFRTDANSSYAGLQIAYTEQWRGLTLHGNYTFSHCLDEVSNGGLLAFSTQGLMSPLAGELNRQHASCDYDVRHNISAYGLYQVPFHSGHAFFRQMFEGWSISGTAILHSGLPFSVLSQPYIANGNGVFQANGASTVQFNAPAYANRIPDVPMYRKSSVAGINVAGTKQWLNPEAFVSAVDPTTGACVGGDSPANCQFGNSGRNSVRGPHYTNSDIYLTKAFPIKEGITFRLDAQMFNAFDHPNFALPSEVEAGVLGVSVPARFGTLESTISPPTGLLGVGLGGDSSPRMIAFQGKIEF